MNDEWMNNASTFFPPSVLYLQSCHDEEEDGEEVKSFEVGDQPFSQMFCPCSGQWQSCLGLKPCPGFMSEGEGDGEAEAAVSAGSPAWARSCRNGATNHQRQQRWVCGVWWQLRGGHSLIAITFSRYFLSRTQHKNTHPVHQSSWHTRTD